MPDILGKAKTCGDSKKIRVCQKFGGREGRIAGGTIRDV